MIRILINEGRASDFIDKLPDGEEKDQLKTAFDSGKVVNPHYLQWLWKHKDKEPIQDMVPLVHNFANLKRSIGKPDINRFEPGQIAKLLDDYYLKKTQEKEQKDDVLNQHEFIGQFGPWKVVFPLSMEFSVKWTRGRTDWCTARVNPQYNLFYRYFVNGVFLYYCINEDVPNPGMHEGQDPKGIISVGIANGKFLKPQPGHASVDADNNAYDPKKVFGDHWQAILSKTTSHYNKLDGKFPLSDSLKKDEEFVRKYVLQNLNTFEELMEYWHMTDVRRKIALRTDLPEDMIRKLADDEDEYVRSNISNARNLPEDIVRKFANDNIPTVRISIANNSNLSEDLIRKLAEDTDGRVRKVIAKHPSLPEDLIRKLAEDREEWVKIEISQRPSLPEDLIRKIAEDKSELVRYNISYRHKLPEDVARKLAEDESEAIRQTISENPSLPEDLVKKLAKDESRSVRYAIASRKDLPEDLIRKLANDEDKDVRKEILKNYPEIYNQAHNKPLQEIYNKWRKVIK